MTAEKLMQIIRNSTAFGEYSCSTVSEAMEDSELLEEITRDLNGYEIMPGHLIKPQTPLQVIDSLVDAEQVHWEQSGIYNWKSLRKDAIKELKDTVRRAMQEEKAYAAQK